MFTGPARDATIGDDVRKQVIHGPEHYITDVSDNDGRNVWITTNLGSWEFALSEPVLFPRHQDGKPIHWTNEDPPTYDAVAVWDTLPPRLYGAHPSQQPYTALAEMMGVTVYEGDHQPKWDYPGDWSDNAKKEVILRWKSLRQTIQTVAAVGSPSARWPLARIWTTDESGLSHFDVCRGEMLTFPRPDLKYSYGRRKPAIVDTRDLATYGPYRVIATGRSVMLATHPSRRGAWPAFVKLPKDATEDGEICRPPPGRSVARWNELEYIGDGIWSRHPRDPRWGSITTVRSP